MKSAYSIHAAVQPTPGRLAERLGAALEAQRRQAMVWAAVALGAGVAVWFQLPWVGQRQAALVAALGLGLAALATRHRWPALAPLLFALGMVAAERRSLEVAAPPLVHRLSADWHQGRVLAVQPRAGGERWRLIVEREALRGQPPVRLRIALDEPPAPGLLPGARVAVRSPLLPVAEGALPAGWSPARDAWFRGISATGRATEPPIVLEPARDQRLGRLRQRLTRALQARFEGPAGGVAAALVTGEKGLIEPGLREAFALAGLAHLLTVSGFHVGLVVSGAFLLARGLLALWPWLVLRVSVRALAAGVAAAAGVAYAMLSGLEVPAMRAAGAALVVLAALALGRNPFSLAVLAAVAIAILLVRPETLMGASFQLSFAAVALLVWLASTPFAHRRLKPRRSDGLPRRLGRYALALGVSSLLAEAVLTPIAIAHFGRAGIYGALANLAAIPWTSFVVMPLMVLQLMAEALGLGAWVAPLTARALNILVAIGVEVGSWPGAQRRLPAVPGAALGMGLVGGLVLLVGVGWVRLLGAPLLAAGLALALWAPRPDLFISADGRQVGLMERDTLWVVRPTRGSWTTRLWAEAAAVERLSPWAEYPDAACDRAGCALERRGLAVLVLAWPRHAEPAGLPAACAAADIVVAPVALGEGCRPRWLRLDRAALLTEGAVAVDMGRRRLVSAGRRHGDHPWSPAATPGLQKTLLGRERWIELLAD